MSISVVPAYDISLAGGESSDQELPYNIYGTSNESDAFFAMIANMLPIYQGKFPASARIDRKAEDVFIGVVSYKTGEGSQNSPLTDDPGGSTMQFDISTETQHITQSLSTISKTGVSGARPATDHKGAINVTSDGIEGCDILVSTLAWSETHYFPVRAIDRTYVNVLKVVCGRMNADTFRGFAKGEVLFIGCAGALNREKSRWELTYKFLQSDTVRNLQVGEITVTEKLGWDYLWVEYAAVADENAKRIARRPYGVYVERVYEFANYSALRLNN